ncbi:hypothetical protein B0A50_01293 [Salinomyces thailandicus]|uniref:Calcium permease n=1 Tax=Salinomyces thailandicus TaxID=706561 RepID=A0A4U0UA85_9PEZI|nr:hypothetical protein B0A50_01293 [Salinomyces thailandica]
MADHDNRPQSRGIATQDYAQPDTPVSDTRRTSTTSLGNSDAGMQASQTSLLSEGQPRRQRPRPLEYGSISGATTGRTQSSAPSNPQTPRRPGPKRLPSSAAPRKGQEFSADDDPEEVDKDLELQRSRTRQQKQQERERQLRRRESTIRRRPAAQTPQLRTVESDESEEREVRARASGSDAAVAVGAPAQSDGNGDPSSEDTLQGDDEEEEREEEEEEEQEEAEETSTPDDEEDDADLSDTESFTLKDRQEAINETHPFGIRIWKPALYKKSRSVQRNAEGDIHSSPGGNVSRWLFVFNCLWAVIFGWWLAAIASLGGLQNLALAFLFNAPGCYEYGRVLINLAHYLFYPFGKYVKLERDEAYLDEDEGEGRSIGEYERWQTGELEEGRLFFGPTDINRSIIGRRRDELEDLDPAPDETDSLLGRQGRPTNEEAERARIRTKKRMFGRGKWNIGRVVFFASFYFLITPFLFLVSALCWFLVFTIPMGKTTLLLFHHLRRHPLAMSFHTDSHYARVPTRDHGVASHAVLLCTYRAVGLKYWKYTIDGTNIFLINLLGLVAFAIVDYFLLYQALGLRTWLTSPGLLFTLSLASVIPLAYFIGQAVASISAQSSMGVGATINAFFSTIVEVFLYCVALKEGKSPLVEGSIIGSIFAGILFLPGLSMCFGALKRKTQRFNVKSAGVTSTMLLFAVIGAFGPTLFYQIYGSHDLTCHQCTHAHADSDCRRCYFEQVPAVHDRFFREAVRPYCWFAALCLFLSYVVGLLFTLRTHAAVIWNNEPDERREAKLPDQQAAKAAVGVPGTAGLVMDLPSTSASTTMRPQGLARGETVTTLGSLAGKGDVRDSGMYKRILTQSLRQAGYAQAAAGGRKDGQGGGEDGSGGAGQTPFLVPPRSAEGEAKAGAGLRLQGLSVEDNRALVQQVAELAATAATVAARDAAASRALSGKKPGGTVSSAPASGSTRHAHPPHHHHQTPNNTINKEPALHRTTNLEPNSLGDPTGPAADDSPGGHDAPNWSRPKSALILLSATLAYALMAEILVDTVDSLLTSSSPLITQKFLGITLFALVPNATEFLNAISFAMNGNVALSMEIGSSYALQVMLLQIPALVLFSAIYTPYLVAADMDLPSHTFSLIFPQWDMVMVILGVFLMGWVVGEGKSNYFKGSTLIFTYLVVTVGFWFSGFAGEGISAAMRVD